MTASRGLKEIGHKLAALRQRAGWSTADLSARTAVPAKEIETIESGGGSATVGQLVTLGRALGVSPGHFFEAAHEPHRVEVVRATDRWRVERASTESGTSLSYSYEALSFRLTERLMQPFLIEVHLFPGDAVQASQHDGEEFIYVLEGELNLEISGDVHHLCAGDSAYYDSRLPHVLRSATAHAARAIVVLATASSPSVASALNRAF